MKLFEAFQMTHITVSVKKYVMYMVNVFCQGFRGRLLPSSVEYNQLPSSVASQTLEVYLHLPSYYFLLCPC